MRGGHASSSPPPTDELVRRSSFVFAGTVLESGASNLRVLEASENLVLVRVDLPLRVDPALGDVAGRIVTLEAQAPRELEPGFEAVFFTRSWIHGDELAVHELGHVGIERTEEVAAAIERLPDLHLADRLRDADLVVHAEVVRTRRLRNLPRERRAPDWAEATLEIRSSLKGRARGARLLFPTSVSHHWYRAPRFRRGQRGIFILRQRDPHAGRWLAAVGEPERIMTALDPADVQPESELGRVRALIRGPRS